MRAFGVFLFLHITRTICLLSSSNDMSDKEHHFEEANHASHLEWMGRGTAVLVIYLLSKDQEQSRLEVTTSTAIVFRHIRQLSMPSSCFITEPSHCDILGGQAKGLMCGPANMSFVEDIGPFWMVLLHFALCRYRVHEFPGSFEGLESKGSLNPSVVVCNLPFASALRGESSRIAAKLFFILARRIFETHSRT